MSRILLIEDDLALRGLFATILQDAGFDVAEAEDGVAGLAWLDRHVPDAVVLDLMTPRMHGYEVIQHLRSSPGTARVPIIVLSAKPYVADQRKAIELGATVFLQKPCRNDALIAAIRDHLEHPRLSFWGVRGSIAAPGPETVRYGGNTPCCMIEHEGTSLILDAGTGIRSLGIGLQAASQGKPLDLHVLITHTHWDHIQGFPFFVPAFVPGNRVNVYGPRSPDKPLERVLRGQMDQAYFPVALGDLACDLTVTELRGNAIDIGPFHITTHYMNHPGITLGFRIEIGDQSIVYATDTEPYRDLLVRSAPDDGGPLAKTLDDGLVSFATGADVYVADAQYGPDEYAAKTGWGHSCYVDAVDVAIRAGVRQLVLFSHDPMHSDEAVDRKLEHAQAIAAERGSDLQVMAAAEGDEIYVRPDGPSVPRRLRAGAQAT